MMHKIGYILLRALIWIPAHLPLWFHHGFAHFLCWLLRDVFHYRRDVVMTNLSRSFPEKKYKELTEIADRFYLHLADIIVEGIWYGGCTNPKRFVKNCPEEMVNPEVIQDLMDKSPAVMILNSHCGNWEFYGSINYFDRPEGSPCPFTEDNVVVVYKRPSSKVWDRFLRENRATTVSDKEHFDGYVETSEFLRYALVNLAAGKKKLYNMNTDQAPYRNADRMHVGQFLHQDTYTMAGGVAIACKKGMSVAYMNVSCVKRGRYRLTFTPICEDASREDPVEIMKTYYSLLQRDIEAQPWNYLWTHKRWK